MGRPCISVMIPQSNMIIVKFTTNSLCKIFGKNFHYKLHIPIPSFSPRSLRLLGPRLPSSVFRLFHQPRTSPISRLRSPVLSRHFPLDSISTNVLSLLSKPYCGAGSVKDRKRWGVGTSPHYFHLSVATMWQHSCIPPKLTKSPGIHGKIR